MAYSALRPSEFQERKNQDMLHAKNENVAGLQKEKCTLVEWDGIKQSRLGKSFDKILTNLKHQSDVNIVRAVNCFVAHVDYSPGFLFQHLPHWAR